MATVKRSYDDILNFRNAAQQYINRHPDRTKLHYAIEKMLKKTKNHFEDYADKENDIRVDCALLDEKKAFVHIEVGGQKVLATDPSKAKEQQSKMRLLGRGEVEVEVYYTTETPKDLEAMWYPHFMGFVLPEDIEETESTLKKSE